MGLLTGGCDPKVVIGYDAIPDARVDEPALDAQLDDAASTADAEQPDAMVRGPLSQLPWPSGAHYTHEVAAYQSFASFRGRAVDIANLYVDRNSWQGLVTPGWPIDVFASFPGKLVLSEPLYPLDMGNNKDCAAGAYDAQWKKLGTFLVEKGRADTIIRLGWGHNDPSHFWRTDADPKNWIACFQHIVMAVRSTNPRVQFDWSFDPIASSLPQSGNPYDAYPGDAYVDIVGMDEFDRLPATHDEASWQARCEAPLGACRLAAFARNHGKQLAFGEWGATTCGVDAGGDNSFYIRKMFQLFQQNADILAYESYFDEVAGDVCSSLQDGAQLPSAAAEYRRLYAP